MPLYYILIFYFIMFVLDFGSNLFCQWYCAKKCHYNCSICKNWRCYKHYCDKKRGI